ncbi:Putative Holliday junction resolvase [Arsenophonus endosymbiont of Aleurodicus dispersus]|uniref:Holliday junction resolvase RuvX n=1 Tax=Arsenophonus endosymbiont of Aleurodicus dispersus TaxID=235559 RepID=UPI000EB43C2B|nr:Holliday junction resolvase RuvX [Arsenophonus endosymbiont of Aleurodicus dispersus]VAY02360.1 Putative Holliday junction resolvase [Arsenophonus endosymbiont of Aleurodicus dispersus]
MENRTIIAFDFGTLSVGIAIGQEITETAHPLTAIKTKNDKPNWLEIGKIIQEWQPKLAIVGLPLNMDGTEQPISNQARKFANRLQVVFDIQVKLHDERLTTIEARAHLFNIGGYRALNKSKIDSISSVFILESWFLQHA